MQSSKPTLALSCGIFFSLLEMQETLISSMNWLKSKQFQELIIDHPIACTISTKPIWSCGFSSVWKFVIATRACLFGKFGSKTREFRFKHPGPTSILTWVSQFRNQKIAEQLGEHFNILDIPHIQLVSYPTRWYYQGTKKYSASIY